MFSLHLQFTQNFLLKTKQFMKKSFRLFSLSASFFAALLVLSFTSCKKDKKETPEPIIDNTITGVVSRNADFSTLKAAVVKADLAATLSGTGPFTVFAPNNNAFAASGITSEVLSSLSEAQVKDIILYHAIPSKIMSSEVPAGPNAEVAAANGGTLYVTKNANGVFVNGIKVIQADIAASNGIIHAIEKVLMPASGTVVNVALSDTTFSYLVAAVTKADLAGTLSGAGPFTVFAPTNDAFRAAGFPTIASIQAADPNVLAEILTYHVIGARVFSSDLTDGAMPTTVNGGQVTIGLMNGATVKGNGNTSASNIIATNILATNGVVHVIDSVLLP